MKKILSHPFKPLFWLVILLSSALLGSCQHAQQVMKKDLVLTEQAALASGKLPKTVYGVQIKGLGTMIRVKRFGLKPMDDTSINIFHGLEFEFEPDSIGGKSRLWLDIILKRSGYASVEAFTRSMEAGSPVFPGSPYTAVEFKFGEDLFLIAQDSAEEADPSPDWLN